MITEIKSVRTCKFVVSIWLNYAFLFDFESIQVLFATNRKKERTVQNDNEITKYYCYSPIAECKWWATHCSQVQLLTY